MSGWAVRIDLSYYRAVDGPHEDPDNPSALYPDYANEFFLSEADGPPPSPVSLPAQIEAAAIAMLDSKQRVAILQISAIQSRIDAINDAIEFEEALPEEIAELPGLSALLILWKKYRIALGRVITIAGWYQAPTWPIMPDPYTSETTASAPDQA